MPISTGRAHTLAALGERHTWQPQGLNSRLAPLPPTPAAAAGTPLSSTLVPLPSAYRIAAGGLRGATAAATAPTTTTQHVFPVSASSSASQMAIAAAEMMISQPALGSARPTMTHVTIAVVPGRLYSMQQPGVSGPATAAAEDSSTTTTNAGAPGSASATFRPAGTLTSSSSKRHSASGAIYPAPPSSNSVLSVRPGPLSSSSSANGAASAHNLAKGALAHHSQQAGAAAVVAALSGGAAAWGSGATTSRPGSSAAGDAQASLLAPLASAMQRLGSAGGGGVPGHALKQLRPPSSGAHHHPLSCDAAAALGVLGVGSSCSSTGGASQGGVPLAAHLQLPPTAPGSAAGRPLRLSSAGSGRYSGAGMVLQAPSSDHRRVSGTGRVSAGQQQQQQQHLLAAAGESGNSSCPQQQHSPSAALLAQGEGVGVVTSPPGGRTGPPMPRSSSGGGAMSWLGVSRWVSAGRRARTWREGKSGTRHPDRLRDHLWRAACRAGAGVDRERRATRWRAVRKPPGALRPWAQKACGVLLLTVHATWRHPLTHASAGAEPREQGDERRGSLLGRRRKRRHQPWRPRRKQPAGLSVATERDVPPPHQQPPAQHRGRCRQRPATLLFLWRRRLLRAAERWPRVPRPGLTAGRPPGRAGRWLAGYVGGLLHLT